MRRALLAVLLCLAAPVLAAPAKLMPGDVALQFVRPDFQGRAVDLRTLRGKLVLIDFWASWCAPCIVAMPSLIALQKNHSGDLRVIGISMDDAPAAAKEVATQFRFNYPLLMGDAKFGTLYGGVLGLPVQMLVGRDGKIVRIWRGEVAPAEVEKAVRTALSSQQ